MNWEENVRRVVPYVPGEQPKDTNVIKLNTNENPYPPASGVEKLKQEFSCDRLRLYPDPEATVLVDAIAKRYGVKPAQVFVGVGSDDVLAMAFLTFSMGKSRYFSRILPTRSMMCGRTFTGYPIRPARWMKISG